jgi:hypothetical protein
LVLAGLAMIVLLMMAGLGVDVGYLRYEKQQMQKAADAGALAAASAVIYNGDYMMAGKNDAAANGFTDGTDGVTVTVNSPVMTPGDPFVGLPGYAEVIVAQARPTFFMRIAGYGSVNVSSRAVATTTASSSGCAFALDQTDARSLVIDNGVTIGAACGYYVESNSPDALDRNATGAASGSYIGVVGGVPSDSGFQCTSGLPSAGCPSTGIAQFQDPLYNVPAPTPATGCATPIYTPTTVTYPAGTYCSGILITDSRTYIFGPGLITVEGGMSTTLGTTPTLISGSGGVLFYLTGGASYGGLTINPGANVRLNPQTTGPQAGILFFQDRSISSLTGHWSSFNGSGSSGAGLNNFSGTFYFPTTKLSYAGRANPSLANAIILVAGQIEFTGSAELNSGVLPGGLSPIGSAVLVE